MAGLKFDSGKVRMDLLPPDALFSVAQVLTLGAVKYGDRNWEEGVPASKCEAALLRHLYRWKLHEEFDEESNLNHLAHMATNALMMLAQALRSTKGFDDRSFTYAFDPTLREIFNKGEVHAK